MCCIYDPWCAVEGCTTATGLAAKSDGKIIIYSNLAIMDLMGATNWYLVCHAPATPACLQFVMKYPNHTPVPGKYCVFHGGDRSKHVKPKPSKEDWTVDGDEKLGKDGSEIVAASEKWFAKLEEKVKNRGNEVMESEKKDAGM